MMFNIGSHASMSPLNSNSILASHEQLSVLEGPFSMLPGAFQGGTTSYFYHGAMRYVNSRDVLEDDVASRLFGAPVGPRASSSARPPEPKFQFTRQRRGLTTLGGVVQAPVERRAAD